MKLKTLKIRLLQSLLVAVAYFASLEVTVLIFPLAERIPAVWLPAGTAAAAVIVFGAAMGPVLFACAFLTYTAFLTRSGIPDFPAVSAALFAAAGCMLQALFCGLMTRRYKSTVRVFSTMSDVFLFAVVILTGSVIHPSLTLIAFRFHGIIAATSFTTLWWTWWMAGMSAILVLAPMFIMWAQNRRNAWEPKRFIEGVGFYALFSVFSYLVFNRHDKLGVYLYPISYSLIPFIIWATFRFGQRGASFLIFIASLIAVWGTARGYGPFAQSRPEEGVLLLQAFIAGISLTAVLLSSALGEIRRSRDKSTQDAHRIQIALEAGNMGAWEWDIQDQKISWSPALEKIHGLKKGTFGGTFEDFTRDIHPDDYPLVLRRIEETLKTGKPYRNEYRIILPCGDIRWLEARGTILFNAAGTADRMLGVCLDVTSRKTYEENIRHYSEQLKKANSDLLQSNQELEQFAYVASHDLQEPLRTVSSFAELLQIRVQHQLEQEERDFVDYIYAAAIRAQRLVHDLLSYARTGPRHDGEQISLEDTVRDILTDLQTAIEETGARFHFRNLPDVHGNRRQIRQLMQNLMGNALKFCHETAPEIRIEGASQNGKHIISVADNGIGIEEQYSERIFDIFQRLHSEKKYPGTGIGLALCRKIVENHGGTIWVKSEKGGGSTFYFSLPRHKKA